MIPEREIRDAAGRCWPGATQLEKAAPVPQSAEECPSSHGAKRPTGAQRRSNLKRTWPQCSARGAAAVPPRPGSPGAGGSCCDCLTPAAIFRSAIASKLKGSDRVQDSSQSAQRRLHPIRLFATRPVQGRAHEAGQRHPWPLRYDRRRPPPPAPHKAPPGGAPAPPPPPGVVGEKKIITPEFTAASRPVRRELPGAG